MGSEDLPRNSSRESQQQTKILCRIQKNLVENCLDMFAGIAENNDNHMKFHEPYGEHLKLASSLQLDSSIRRSASTA